MKRKIFLLSLLLLLTSYFTINTYAETTDITLKLDQKEYVGLGDRIRVQLKAPALNLHTYSNEQVELLVTTSEDPKGFKVIAPETKVDSGIFQVYLNFNLSKSDAVHKSIKVKTGAKIYIRYADIVQETTWKPDDGTIKFDKTAYNGFGVEPTVTLDDNDLNLQPFVKEELNIVIKSTSDNMGITLKLVEKSEDSGVFIGKFGMDLLKSNDANDKLKIAYNGTITTSYNDTTNTSGAAIVRTANVNWKPCTGTVKFNKSALSGLQTGATVTLTDQDLNKRTDYVDTATVKLISDGDPNGFTLTLYETDKSTGVFSNNIKFSAIGSEGGKGVIKVKPSDKLVLEYKDTLGADNLPKTASASATFQLTEATITTSAANDTGSGNQFDFTISDPDANDPKVKDIIITRVGVGSSTNDLLLNVTETGNNTGKFKMTIYPGNGNSSGQILGMSGTDKINIKYTDTTIPTGGTKDVVKTITWTVKSTALSMDKTVYTGYNTAAKVTLFNMDLNNDSEKAEYLEVEILTGNDKNMELELKETGANTGKFTGTFYFGRRTDEDTATIKVTGNDSINIRYVNKEDKFDIYECDAEWTPQDAEFTISKQVYCGSKAPVLITLKDYDAGDSRSSKDEVKVKAKVQGSTKEYSVTLTETGANTGIYKGTMYINGGSPSIKLVPGDRFDVFYTDEDTKSGTAIEKVLTSSWTGISEATITLDKGAYVGYDSYMIVNVTDPDGNLYTDKRESIEVAIKTIGSNTSYKYTLKETGSNTGVFTAKIKIIKEGSTSSAIHVRDTDTLTVTYTDKRVSASASFTK